MPREVSRDEVQQLLAEGAQLVDVRPAQEYQDEHIAGTIASCLRLNEETA